MIDQFPEPSAVAVPIDVVPALKISAVAFATAPVPVNVGVLSEVLLSVLEVPLSLPLSRSGVDGAEGPVESSVYASAEDAPEVPAPFVALAVIEIEPAESAVVVANQLPALSARVFATDVTPENTSMCVLAAAVPCIVAVVSLVMLSVEETPASLVANSSRDAGAGGLEM